MRTADQPDTTEATTAFFAWARRLRQSLADLESEFGVSKQAISNWKARGLPVSQVPTAARLMGLTFEELMAGRDSTRRTAVLVAMENNPAYPSVRRVRFKLQAGVAGFAVEDLEDDGAPIVFRRDWFDLHGYQPEKLLAARVSGASMEPSLWDGDLVVINTAQTQPKDGRVFALNVEGVMAIKRLVRDAGEWHIRSDSADKVRYPDKRTHEGVSVIGEVVYKQSERI